MKYWKWGNRAMTEATLAEQLQQVRQYAQELKDQGFVSYPWEYEEISLALFAVCEAAEQFKSAKAQAAYWEGLADAQQRNGYYTQLKAAERRIMLLEEQLKQCRAKLEAAQAANDPATIQEYADYYSVAAQQFPATGEAPMTYDEWLADAQEANEGGIIAP